VPVVHARRAGGRRSFLPDASPEGDAQWFAQRMKRKYSQLSKAAKKGVLAVMKKEIPPLPGPGRPRRADVTESMRMEAEGVSRKESTGA